MFRLFRSDVRRSSLSSSRSYFFQSLFNHFQHSRKAKKALQERGIDLSRLTAEQAEKFKPILRLRSAFRVVNVVMGVMGITAFAVWYSRRAKNFNRAKEIEEDFKPVWMNLKSFEHKGALINNYLLPEQIVEKLKDLRDFQFRPDDCLCVSFPKSGVTLVQELLFLLENNFDYSLAQAKDLSERYTLLEWPSVQLARLDTLEHRRFFKTHLPPQFFNDSFPKAKVSSSSSSRLSSCRSDLFLASDHLCLSQSQGCHSLSLSLSPFDQRGTDVFRALESIRSILSSRRRYAFLHRFEANTTKQTFS